MGDIKRYDLCISCKKKVNSCTIGKTFITCCHCHCKQNKVVPLICTHPVINAELTLIATQNVFCNITLLSSDDDIVETLLELTDIEIKYNTSTFIVIGTE